MDIAAATPPVLTQLLARAAVLVLLLLFPLSDAQFPPYANHTVGGATGWTFDDATDTPATNYSAWAGAQSFYLGDFLVFKSSGNTSVVQTYNATTYRRCDVDQDFGNLTSEYGADLLDNGGNVGGGIPVELKVEGDNYYFSDAGGGKQCRKGMRFRIVVKHGRGLPSPPPPPPPPSPPPPPPTATEAEPLASEAPGVDGGCWWMGMLLPAAVLMLSFR